MYILDNPSRLARLLISIKVKEKTNRPLNPVDVAKEIEFLLKDLDGDQNELNKRLPIGHDVTNQFLRLLKLPPVIQGMVVWGESKHETGGIGFSVAARIASLDSQDDMSMMAGTITEMSRPVRKEEIKGILSQKKYNPDKTLEKCLEEVLNVTRPIVIAHYIFLSGLDPNIARSIKQRADKLDEDTHKFTSNILLDIFPKDSFKSAKVFSDCIRLTLDKNGSDFISTYAHSHNIPMQCVLNHMLSSMVMVN